MPGRAGAEKSDAIIAIHYKFYKPQSANPICRTPRRRPILSLQTLVLPAIRNSQFVIRN
jgi:hypothetical protein